MTIGQLIYILKINNKLKTQAECSAFLEALTQLKKRYVDAIFLLDMLYVFNDGVKQLPLMSSLLHYIETFDHSKLIEALIEATPVLVTEASNWLQRFYIRILNNPDAKNELKRQIFLHSSEKRITYSESFTKYY